MTVATIGVPVATLWTSPDRVRGVDKLAVNADVRGWVTAMSLNERDDLNGRTESQLLLGEQVVVDEVAGPFARIVALRQPAARFDARGYPGWINADHLRYDTVPEDPTHVVAVTWTAILDRPHGRIIHSDVVLGTEVTVAGAPVDGHLPLAGEGYIPTDAVTALATRPPSGADLLTTASLMRGIPYVWGGVSPFGIDCSGLVHLTCRRHGITIPRNASDQATATTPLTSGEERAGDAYFFQRTGSRVHHVGFVAAAPDPDGTMHMLHASGTRNGIVCEPVAGERLDTLVSVHRLI